VGTKIFHHVRALCIHFFSQLVSTFTFKFFLISSYIMSAIVLENKWVMSDLKFIHI
jgi:hypothetical protein